MTLHGRILRTHGIKEKILLAKREKIVNVIVPIENKSDVEMLAENIKEGISIQFVTEFRDVFGLLFDVPLSNDLSDQIQHERVENKLEQAAHH
jgi:ATP-dependent Lon protease